MTKMPSVPLCMLANKNFVKKKKQKKKMNKNKNETHTKKIIFLTKTMEEKKKSILRKTRNQNIFKIKRKQTMFLGEI